MGRTSVRAFTLVEILIVVVILGIIAGFGVPNFTRAIERARARDAMNNLRVIHAANRIFFARNNDNFNGANLAAINAMNGANSLNIIAAQGVAYNCNAVADACQAVGTNFTATVDLDDALAGAGVNPDCVGTSCP